MTLLSGTTQSAIPLEISANVFWEKVYVDGRSEPSLLGFKQRPIRCAPS